MARLSETQIKTLLEIVAEYDRNDFLALGNYVAVKPHGWRQNTIKSLMGKGLIRGIYRKDKLVIFSVTPTPEGKTHAKDIAAQRHITSVETLMQREQNAIAAISEIARVISENVWVTIELSNSGDYWVIVHHMDDSTEDGFPVSATGDDLPHTVLQAIELHKKVRGQ